MVYRYRIFAYLFIVAAIVAALVSSTRFGLTIVVPVLAGYLPCSVVSTVVASFYRALRGGLDDPVHWLPTRCWRYSLPVGLFLLSAYPYLDGSFIPLIGMWTILLSLEWYLDDLERPLRARKRARRLAKAEAAVARPGEIHQSRQTRRTSFRFPTFGRGIAMERAASYVGLLLAASAVLVTPTTFLRWVIAWPIAVYLPLSMLLVATRWRTGWLQGFHECRKICGIPVPAAAWVVFLAGVGLIASFLHVASIPLSAAGMVLLLLVHEAYLVHREAAIAVQA